MITVHEKQDRLWENFLLKRPLNKKIFVKTNHFFELLSKRDDEPVFLELTKRRNGGITFNINIIIETTKIYKYWSDFYSKIEFIRLTVFFVF